MSLKCISRLNLKDGCKLAKFQYRGDLIASELACCIGVACDSFSIKIPISDEFELVWKIRFVGENIWGGWFSKLIISLVKCNKNISFNIMIQSDNNKLHTIEGSYKAGSLPFEYQSKAFTKASTKGTITFDIYYEEDEVSPTIEHTDAVLGRYEKLLENKKFSDVVFVFEDNEEIRSHSLVLSAQSDVFATMFDSDMLEKKTGRVEIVDIEPSIFHLLLQFMYCGKIVSEDTDELLKLIVAANKYSVTDLVTVCASRLTRAVSVDNVVEILIVADQINAVSLKKNCINVIVKNKQKIVDTPRFEKLKSHKDLVIQIFDFLMGKQTEMRLSE